MDAFTYRNGELHAEDIPVRDIAERHGTPLYIYSRNHLRAQFRDLQTAMAGVAPLICYSVKANSNAVILRALMEEGAGFDIVSGGELYRTLRLGADASRIVYAGVGKTRPEIEYALKSRIRFFTVESESEARRISERAEASGFLGRVAFRANPDVDPQTHKYISTGKRENKFGLDLERIRRAYAEAARLPGIEIAGLHLHIGSQILSADPFGHALEKVRDLCAELKALYPTFRQLDIGGGIGIRYAPDQTPLAPGEYARRLIPILKDLSLDVVLEPGRFLVGNAGILVCRVEYLKEGPHKTFVVVDAGMNDLIRPSLYGAYQEIAPVTPRDGTFRGDVVGPICESGDFFASDRELPRVAEGDLLAVMGAGAYGFAMSSNYNSRPRPIEIVVDGDRTIVARQRETWEDLVRGEFENHDN